MSFDKTKAMRNAEKYLSQGKISAAIGEFRQVVAHDSRDFGTMNMLGDLYVKNSETKPAIDCYRAVAEHYAKQGFAQKAIAVYNKISKISKPTAEITLRLAELYREKGSKLDARNHFEKVAEQYQKEGRRVEALDIFRQIAELDAEKAEPFLAVGDGFAAENCKSEAAAAYAEAGRRFERTDEIDKAFNAYLRAVDLEPGSYPLLQKLVAAGRAAGRIVEANALVLSAHDAAPHDPEIHSLVVECQVEVGDRDAAERSLIKLIETDPACYPQLLELSRLHLDSNDAASAARVLSIASEHMLMAGEAETLSTQVAEVLQLDPEHLGALRIMVRCASWLKDESGMRASLTLMAKSAKAQESLEDERFALSQLVMLVPQDVEFASRLKEVNAELGVEDADGDNNLFDERFGAKLSEAAVTAEPLFESSNGNGLVGEFEIIDADDAAISDTALDADGSEDSFDLDDFGTIGLESEVVDPASVIGSDDPGGKEIDSIKFYIESGYMEIAEKAIEEFIEEHGRTKAIQEIQESIRATVGDEEQVEIEFSAEADPIVPTNGTEPALGHQSVKAEHTSPNGSAFGIDDLRNELGIDELNDDEDVDGDYETHYHTAVAYQEMYLLEDAIKEFQQAVSLVEANDGTRRYFQCSNLLGHCFMQLGKPNLAVRWFLKTLENIDTTDDERLGIWYELANAYEADGDYEMASRYYEQVYAENINFRDVASRVNNVIAAG